MKSLLFAGSIALGLCLVGSAAVAEVGSTSCCPRSCCTCPDDYCPKPMPCVRGAPCGCCDDYCPKPMPCVHCLPCCCGPDDYCPKPFCYCMPPCWPAWYTCGPVCCSKQKCGATPTAAKDTEKLDR